MGAAELGAVKGWDVFLSEGGKLSDAAKNRLRELGAGWEEGGHSEARISEADLAVKSPGIPQTALVVAFCKAKNIEIIGEIEFAYRYLPEETGIIAITGSNGKTTTASLVYALMEAENFDVALRGNIGDSFAADVAQYPRKHYVLEVSSFQLEDVVTFRPDIAVLLNINNNHLNRYAYDIRKYAAAKFNIVKNQTADDFFIYDMESEALTAQLAETRVAARKLGFAYDYQPGASAWIEETQIIINMSDTQSDNNKKFGIPLDELKLKGKHNAKNAMASGITGRLREIRNERIRKVMTDFENLDHRMEYFAEHDGVHFINDSKATNVNATFYALDSLKGKVVWIAGGVDKGNDYGLALELAREKVKALVLIGKDRDNLAQAFGEIVPECLNADSLEEAVRMASERAESGETVLLSPACASFDMFEDYIHRGNAYKQAVNEWIAESV